MSAKASKSLDVVKIHGTQRSQRVEQLPNIIEQNPVEPIPKKIKQKPVDEISKIGKNEQISMITKQNPFEQIQTLANKNPVENDSKIAKVNTGRTPEYFEAQTSENGTYRSDFVFVNSGYMGSLDSVTDRSSQAPTSVIHEQYWSCSKWPHGQKVLAVAVGVLFGIATSLMLIVVLSAE